MAREYGLPLTVVEGLQERTGESTHRQAVRVIKFNQFVA